jgi:hypothetical protein
MSYLSYKRSRTVRKTNYGNPRIRFPLEIILTVQGKGKTISVEAWRGPEGSSNFRISDFNTIGT